MFVSIDLNHFAVAITKYPTVRPWMKLNALAHHIGGPWLGFGCHRRAPAGMTVNTVNTPRFRSQSLSARVLAGFYVNPEQCDLMPMLDQAHQRQTCCVVHAVVVEVPAAVKDRSDAL
jgi:hypothetical protein